MAQPYASRAADAEGPLALAYAPPVTATPDTVSLKKAVWILGSLFLVAAGITSLFLGMRAVMDIGGACGQGGAIVYVRPCPEGVPLLMIGGIWIGIIAAFAYGWASLGAGIPSFVGLFWPALFMSLGWNFLQYAFDPPFGEGIVYGWLIPGIIFELMGAIPLWLMFKTVGLTPRSTRVRSVLAPPGAKAMATAMRAVVDARKAAPSPPRPDMVSELERLTALHRSGALSDDEFEKAKRRLLA
ncbi:MAG: SHOCT domain-containing protein [Acidimicrobiia bacterium]|nr:SHOCT domain-containing protein [Acidimicrobiia bacterium]